MNRLITLPLVIIASPFIIVWTLLKCVLGLDDDVKRWKAIEEICKHAGTVYSPSPETRKWFREALEIFLNEDHPAHRHYVHRYPYGHLVWEYVEEFSRHRHQRFLESLERSAKAS
ncbi:hypothetical protein [Pseudomonas sp. B14(2017)]|uniref:hypothetical protein n=1 Tax=Pseudomonas sp. B14(2017) TaxID=1981745 RepID=UPI000A1FA315|nr:hypothetical protein [Pseudomonas sp. B14(2017)]